MCSEHLAENTIRGVTYGVANGHEEWIVNEQVSNVNYQESLGDSGTARPMCSSGRTKFSPSKVPELMQTILSMHAVLTVQWGC